MLESVDQAYRQFDDDRAMLERSLDLSSQELLQANTELRALVGAFPDQILRLDSHGVILAVKGATHAEPTRGWTIGRPIVDVVDAAGFERGLVRSVEAEGVDPHIALQRLALLVVDVDREHVGAELRE